MFERQWCPIAKIFKKIGVVVIYKEVDLVEVLFRCGVLPRGEHCMVSVFTEKDCATIECSVKVTLFVDAIQDAIHPAESQE